MDYDKLNRDPVAKKFYNSAGWKRCRASKLTKIPWCEYKRPGEKEPCGQPALHVHHLKPIATKEGWERRLDPANLQSVCIPCHNRAEAEATALPFVSGMLQLVEDDEYYFDAEAADRPVRFFEKFLRHYEGEFEGQPFILDSVQRRIIGDVYGWTVRKTKLRRFTEVWFEAAAGAGKSPLLAGLGIYGLGFDGEPGAQVFSQAGDKIQAKVVFETAKRFIEESPELRKRLIVKSNTILHPASKSTWEVIAGVGKKSGFRPSLVLGDEVHEWRNRQVYDALQSRMAKRRQPLYWLATNAGEDKLSFAYTLHRQAAAVLSGTKKNPGLYPIIWAAPESMEIDDPEAWKQANRLLGTTIHPSKVAEKCAVAKGDPTLEARFRRLFLTQWIQGTKKWLDLAVWKAAQGVIDPELIKDAPLYTGVDLSLVDDLSAVVDGWMTRTHLYVDAHFWVPKATAKRYEEKLGIPYSSWAESGAVTIVDEPTISAGVRLAIADRVIARSKIWKQEAVCFDKYKADDCTAAIAAAGIKCVPIQQGWSVSPGSAELDRRLKEKSVTVTTNPVLEWNADVVEVRHDERGNFWPVKPNAKGEYAGTRAVKIDGIAALVTMLTEARKHNFPPEQSTWKGQVLVI